MQKSNDTKASLEAAIMQVLQYFHYFVYAPTAEQIYGYLSVKAHKNEITGALQKLVQEKTLISEEILFNSLNSPRTLIQTSGRSPRRPKTFIYAMRGEGICFKNHRERAENTAFKIK